MAHESFENAEIADFMNKNFINVSGGWPLTVFLTSGSKPFFGGTYFPPEDRRRMPGFNRVLKTVADAYKNRRGEVEKAARRIIVVLTAETGGSEGEPLVLDILKQAYLTLQRDFDKENGGFGLAPKFPQPMTLEYLLRYFHRTQDKTVLEMVDFTLGKMVRGGIYDQLGGGFHRYATDSSWLVPHFEKMLYPSLPAPYLFCYRFICYG